VEHPAAIKQHIANITAMLEAIAATKARVAGTPDAAPFQYENRRAAMENARYERALADQRENLVTQADTSWSPFRK